MIQRLRNISTSGKERLQRSYVVVKKDIQKRPLFNFYLAILGLFLLIILSNVLRMRSVVEQKNVPEVKPVSLYFIGSVPKITVQAQIEKSGVIQLVALTGGVVQKIHYHEGETVHKGNTIISLSSNYQGGNSFSIQRQLAQTQYTNILDTYDAQKELISRQRDVATASAQNSEELRKITDQSLGDTRNLISLNETMLKTIDANITSLQQNPQPDQTLLQSLQAQKAQLLSGTSQVRAGLRAAEYQAASDKPPAELARLQKDIALKQLEIQEKSLNLSKETARLQAQLANVTEGLMYPSAPFEGVIQRIFVKEFDVISPGMPLALIAQVDGDPITAVAYVPADVAKNVSKLEPSVLVIGNKKYEEYPYFVSTEAVQGNSYAIYYTLPNTFLSDVTQKDSIEIEVPIGYVDSTASAAYVPIDAVYQTSDASYLFIMQKDKALSRKVVLGNVYGKFVEVKKGLHDGDQLITTRNVIEGDKIQITK